MNTTVLFVYFLLMLIGMAGFFFLTNIHIEESHRELMKKLEELNPKDK